MTTLRGLVTKTVSVRWVRVTYRNILTTVVSRVLLATVVMSAIILAMITATMIVTTPAQAAQSGYSTYVLDTYGGSALIPAVQQQLQDVGGGSVAAYQDKLVLRTTPAGYQAVQQLLSQIDHAPTPLKVSVRVGTRSQSSASTQQGRIIVSANGSHLNRQQYQIQGYGNFGNQNKQLQSNSTYQVNTLSGYSASIGTNTLLSLAKPYFAQIYSHNSSRAHNRAPIAIVRINQQVLLDTTKGIALTPTLLANNTVQVSINQVEDRVTGNRQVPVQSQQLATTLTVPRGQWVSIGEVSQTQQQYGNSGYESGESNSSINYPIQIKVD